MSYGLGCCGHCDRAWVGVCAQKATHRVRDVRTFSEGRRPRRHIADTLSLRADTVLNWIILYGITTGTITSVLAIILLFCVRIGFTNRRRRISA